MDVSIAVSLIRGQMGTVVERAVNVAVETVLAEMLKVVGVKFEELKAQLVLTKKDVAALQREKLLKDKENDNIRAKLRYTELKLKYYRQGVEEELQHRASASTLVRIHPPAFTRIHRGAAEASMSCSAPIRTNEEAATRSNQVPECTSSQSSSRRAVRVCCPSDVVASDSSELLLPVSLNINSPVEPLDGSSVLLCPAAQSKDVELDDDCDWTMSLQPHDESLDAAVAPPPVQTPAPGGGQQQSASLESQDRLTQADSSTLPPAGPQVKQEEEEEEVICIKEEPEEEHQEVETCPPAETQPQRSLTDWSRLPGNQSNQSPASSPTSYPLPPLSSLAVLPPGLPPRPAVRPWAKDLSLYEEYKLRRNELRRRNLSRRRELEKTLPQPLLADLVRERREKTRLRVARWRAKRKLQACLNQAQPLGGAAALNQTGFPVSSQQLRTPSASPQSSSFLSSMSSILPFIPSSSSSLLLVPHEHTVTSSSSSSSSSSQISQSQQSSSLMDTEILQ